MTSWELILCQKFVCSQHDIWSKTSFLIIFRDFFSINHHQSTISLIIIQELANKIIFDRWNWANSACIRSFHLMSSLPPPVAQFTTIFSEKKNFIHYLSKNEVSKFSVYFEISKWQILDWLRFLTGLSTGAPLISSEDFVKKSFVKDRQLIIVKIGVIDKIFLSFFYVFRRK